MRCHSTRASKDSDRCRCVSTICTVGHKPILEEKLEELWKAESIDDVFYILGHYVLFFNYDIVEHMINELGGAEDQTYKVELDKHSVFECPPCSLS